MVSELSESKSAPKFELSVVHVAASAGGALTVAVASSHLGAGGTLVGAAAGSVISSVATPLYEHHLHKVGHGVKRFFVSPPAGEPQDAPETPQDAPGRPRTPSTPRHWPSLAVTAAVAFAVVLVSLTGVEAAAGRPVSAMLTGQRQESATTVGQAVQEIAAPPSTPVPYLAPATPESVVADTPSPTTSPSPSPSCAAVVGDNGLVVLSPAACESPSPQPSVSASSPAFGMPAYANPSQSPEEPMYGASSPSAVPSPFETSGPPGGRPRRSRSSDSVPGLAYTAPSD